MRCFYRVKRKHFTSCAQQNWLSLKEVDIPLLLDYLLSLKMSGLTLNSLKQLSVPFTLPWKDTHIYTSVDSQVLERSHEDFSTSTTYCLPVGPQPRSSCINETAL